MKNYKNLNEQISRIKSLFGDDRIHGNLINEEFESSKPLVTEQKWKRLLMNTMKGTDIDSSVYKNIRKALLSVDDAVSTKFLNYKVSNIGDMVKYLDEFPAIWKSSLGEQGFKRFKQTMDTLNDPNYVKKINDIFATSTEKGEQLYAMMRRNVPEETHEIFDEMFPAALANKNLDDVVGDYSSVVVIKNDAGNVTLHTIDNNGNVVKSSDIDTEGNLVKPDPETTVKAQEDVDNRLNRGDGGKVDGDGGKVDGDGGKVDGDDGKLGPDKGTTTTTDPVNPDTNPDVINGQILESIEVGVGKAQGMVKQNVTISELSEHMKKNGGVVFIKEGNSLIPIKNIDEWEVVTMKKVDPSDGVEKEFVVSITKKGTSPDLDGGKPSGDGGGGNGAGPDKSKWKKWWEKQKNSGTREVGGPKGAFDYFRYFFPQTSFVLHKLVWFFRNSKKNLGLYKDPRWSLLNLKYADKGTWLDMSLEGGAKTAFRSGENTVRLVTEQLFYGYVIGVGMDMYRGGDVRVNPIPHWQTWFDKDNDLLIYTSLPIYGTFKTVEYVLTSYGLFDGLREECRKKWEKEVGASKVLNDPRYKACVAEVNKTEEDVRDWKKSLKSFYNTVEKINDMSTWTDEEKKKFCNGEEVNGVTKQGLIDELNELKAGQEKIREFIKRKKSEVVGEESDGLDLQAMIDWLTKNTLDKVKEWIGIVPEDIQSLLLSYKDGEGNTQQIDSVGIDALIQKIGDVCINLNQNTNQVIQDLEDSEDSNDTQEEGECMCPDGSYSTECCKGKLASTDEIQFQVNIIPINIV